MGLSGEWVKNSVGNPCILANIGLDKEMIFYASYCMGLSGEWVGRAKESEKIVLHLVV
jgi:hypothetical protein